jgi:putative redox protein
MELMLVSLAGCTAMDVISILRKKRQDVTGFEVRVQADRADKHPKVFTALRLHYVVSGNGVQAAAVERAMQLSAETYCPAQAMLGQVAPLSMSYEIIDVAVSA